MSSSQLSMLQRHVNCSKACPLKMAGVLLSVGVTILINLYKGNEAHLWNSILQHHKEARVEIAANQLRGTVFLADNSLTFAWWYLIQVVDAKVSQLDYTRNACSIAGERRSCHLCVLPVMLVQLSILFCANTKNLLKQ